MTSLAVNETPPSVEPSADERQQRAAETTHDEVNDNADELNYTIDVCGPSMLDCVLQAAAQALNTCHDDHDDDVSQQQQKQLDNNNDDQPMTTSAAAAGANSLDVTISNTQVIYHALV